jgi:hypothetical protein
MNLDKNSSTSFCKRDEVVLWKYFCVQKVPDFSEKKSKSIVLISQNYSGSDSSI